MSAIAMSRTRIDKVNGVRRNNRCLGTDEFRKRSQGGVPGMLDKTIVLRKKGHWYIINSRTGDEKEIILTLMEYSEQKKYDIAKDEVYALMEQLGWKLEVYIPGLGAA
ncbi:MAG: hypothetical protein FWG74_01895 [Planctomycetes bacterium]|nr:hypothetical protein [Planctomycetota bacterium]